MLILVGSRAAMARMPIGREPKDFDFIATEDAMREFLSARSFEEVQLPEDHRWQKRAFKVDGNTYVEFEIIEPGKSNEMLASLVASDELTINANNFGLIPSLSLLFTLKDSHRYLKNSPHFWKNFFDWHRMNAFGAKIPNEARDFWRLRKRETYNYSHPKLNVSKKDFFKDDNIQYVYDHDSIHRAVAHFDKPAYTYYMEDGAEVNCSKEKFFSVPEEYRLWGVIEEACVLAIERSLVPHPGKLRPKEAWILAYSKVSTSITSGWFRKYAYDNGPAILKMYPEDYWDKFQQGVASGKVVKL